MGADFVYPVMCEKYDPDEPLIAQKLFEAGTLQKIGLCIAIIILFVLGWLLVLGQNYTGIGFWLAALICALNFLRIRKFYRTPKSDNKARLKAARKISLTDQLATYVTLATAFLIGREIIRRLRTLQRQLGSWNELLTAFTTNPRRVIEERYGVIL